MTTFACSRFWICPLIAILSAAAAPAQDKSDSISAKSLMKLADKAQKGVEELRGWKFKRPVKREIYTEPQLRAWIEKKIFEEQYPEAKLRRVQAFLQMTGIIPPNCDIKKTYLDVLLNQIGGFYDPATDTFYMLNRKGSGYGPLVNGMMIAHELTHALDDQYVDLDRMMKAQPQTQDAEFAIGAVIEGSATIVGIRYMMKGIASGEFDISEVLDVSRREMERSKPLIEAPPFFSSLMANYIAGMNFYLRGKSEIMANIELDDPSGELLLKIVKRPPTSSEQILHPEKYWDRDARDEPVLVDDERMAALITPAGYHVVHKDTAGELLCAILTSREDKKLNIILASQASYWTNDDAEGWGGDRFYLLSRGKNEKAAAEKLTDPRGVWMTTWDTRFDRDDFVEAYVQERELPERSVHKLGKRGALFLFGFDQEQAGAIAKRIDENPPPFRSGRKPWSLNDN
ncbi:MAG: hypothetical protein IID33_10905 [Planctomycetes bacterium]|nr:hypothetical protein [Planctomycetota bacterium]